MSGVRWIYVTVSEIFLIEDLNLSPNLGSRSNTQFFWIHGARAYPKGTCSGLSSLPGRRSPAWWARGWWPGPWCPFPPRRRRTHSPRPSASPSGRTRCRCSSLAPTWRRQSCPARWSASHQSRRYLFFKKEKNKSIGRQVFKNYCTFPYRYHY